MSHPSVQSARQMAGAGHLQEAMALLKKAFQENPNDAEIRQALMEIQERMMLEMQVTEKIKKAGSLLEQGQREAAERIVAEVLKIVPGHAAALDLQAKLAPSSPFAGGAPAGPNEFDFGSDLEKGAPLQELSSTGAQPFSEPAEPAELPALQPFDFGAMPEIAPLPNSPAEATRLAGPSGAGAPKLSPAEQEKIRQYIEEGKSLLAQGRVQDAIDVWTRVFILDEENGEAQTLIDQARAALNSNQGELEYSLNEAIAAFNAQDFVRAKPLLEKILQLSPGHREAQYYLSKLPVESSPGQTASTTEAPSAGFELEGGLNLSQEPEAKEAGFEGFELETNLTNEMPPAPAAKPAQPFGSGPLSEEFKFDEPVAKPPQAVPVLPQASPAPPAPAGGISVRAAAAKKKGPSLALILGGAAALLLIGLALLFIPKLFGGGEHTEAPAHAAPPPRRAPEAAPAQQPAAPVAPTLSKEELLRAAGAAAASKDFEKAISLYKQVLAQDAVNQDALSGLDVVRAAQQKQQEEEAKNGKFLKDYQASVKSFRDGDYAESLRLAWRLIYPDDTLARQLGKANSVRALLRNGYYNWAVRDLKSENPRGAEKNLRDLMDADKNDAEARKLLDFTRQYLNKPVDQKYRDAVAAMTYRSFTEIP